MKKLNFLTVVVLVLVLSAQVFASDYYMTNKRFALGAMSLCALNETVQNKESLNVFVLGNENVAEELKIFFNQNIGSVKLETLTFGDELPEITPDVILVCDDIKVDEAKEYCRNNSVFSISNTTFSCQEGLSTALVSKMPKTIEHHYSMTSVYAKINKKALFAEGMNFYSQVWKVAKPIEDSNFDQELVMIQLF